MAVQDFPGNSNSTKHNVIGATARVSSQADKPEKKVLKVVTGDVIQKKKPLGRRFKEIFIGGTAQGAARYILDDVLVPALRNLVSDMVHKGTDKMVWGDGPRRRYDPGPMRPRIQYNSYSDRYREREPRDRVMLPDQPPRIPSNRRELGEVILHSREDADLVIERLQDIIDTYDVASVADLHELIGLPTSYVDNKWGWPVLKYANVRQVREGFLIDLPPAEQI